MFHFFFDEINASFTHNTWIDTVESGQGCGNICHLQAGLECQADRSSICQTVDSDDKRREGNCGRGPVFSPLVSMPAPNRLRAPT